MLRTRVIWALAATTGLAFACLLTSCALTSDRSGTLVGTVRRADTAAAIPGAIVECAGLLAITDTSGDYEIEGISPGERVVSATANGFVDYSRVVDVGEATVHDIVMQIYVPPARIFGYVIHSTHGALGGATVIVGDLSTTTDAQGYYEFPNALQTQYQLTVIKDGYRTYTRQITPNASDFQFDVNLKYLASVTLSPVADANVFSQSPDANAGNSSFLRLFDNGAAKEAFFIRFDLEGIEETAEPVLATLRLYHTEDMGSEAGRTAMAARALSPWQELHITWLNAPSTTGASTAPSTYEDNWFEVVVTPYFTDWLVYGSTNNGLYVDTPSDHSTGRFYFASREYFVADVRPHVVLDYAW